MKLVVGDRALAVIAASLLVSVSDLREVGIHPVERAFPEWAIFREPTVELLQRFRLQLAGTPLRLAAAGDEAGAFQHFQMAGDGGKRDVERLGEIVDGGFALTEAGEDGAPRRVCESGKRLREGVRRLHYLAIMLINVIAKYGADCEASSAV
jgi:hypothetical protein